MSQMLSDCPALINRGLMYLRQIMRGRLWLNEALVHGPED